MAIEMEEKAKVAMETSEQELRREMASRVAEVEKKANEWVAKVKLFGYKSI